MVTKCPVCVNEGTHSQLRQGPTSSTLLPVAAYWDEAGKKHYHDPNWKDTTYACSLGHQLYVHFRSACNQGDFGGEEEVTQR